MKKALKVQRVRMGYNQMDLMLRTGIAQSRLSLLENGYTKPKDEEKIKLARVLRCTILEIFPETGSGSNGSELNER